MKPEAGGGEVCRRHGISERTVYRRKAKCGGMQVSEAARLKMLEDENRRQKKLLAKARAVIERWRPDCNHVRPHSAHGGLTPEAERLNPAAGRLRNPNVSAGRLLPPALEIAYPSPGLRQ